MPVSHLSRPAFTCAFLLLALVGARAQQEMTTAAVKPLGEGQTRGVIHAPARIAITSDLFARVAEVHVRDGETFAKGDPLVSFDCARYAAEMKQAKAALGAAAVELRQKSHLKKFGAAGKGEVDVAAAEVARGDASVELAKVRMEDCVIEAPFDGRVVELTIGAHEMPEPGRPLMTLINDTSLEIELIVPSIALRTLTAGKRFPFKVDETGATITASVDRIGAEVDPVSQTVKIIAVFPQRPQGILAGMSGNALLDAEQVR